MLRIIVIEFIQYWYYTLLYLPCKVIYSCFYHQDTSHGINIDSNISINNNHKINNNRRRSINDNNINNDDNIM